METWASLFSKHFGPLNRVVTLPSNVSIVVIASTHLEERTSSKELSQDAWAFIDTFEKQGPVLLLTHVPLHRRSRCKHSDALIPQIANRGYRTQLSPHDSQALLAKFQPFAVVSGDHHAYCRVDHDGIPEHTISTFSWMQGEMWPGYALLSIQHDFSLVNNDAPISSLRFNFSDCILPPQLAIFLWDAVALALSLLVLLVFHIWRLRKLSLPYRLFFRLLCSETMILAGPLLLLFCVGLIY